MQGRFDVTLLDAAGKDDAFFQEAIRAQKINSVLKGLEPRVKCHGVQNRIFDNMAGYVLNKLFSLGNCAYPYYDTSNGPQAALAFICLMSTDSDTSSYTEDWTHGDIAAYAVTDSVGNTAAKRFEEDQIAPWEIWSGLDGRDSVHFRNRWLYTPGQATSSTIKSVGIFFRSDADDLSNYYRRRTGRLGRVRLKDDAGYPITLNKTAEQVLLIEYTFVLASI